MQHNYCDPINGVKKELKYSADRSDVIQHICHYPSKQVMFYFKQSIAMMKRISK